MAVMATTIPAPRQRTAANGLRLVASSCYGGLTTIAVAVPCGVAHEESQGHPGMPVGTSLLLGRLLTQGSALYPTAEALALFLESLGGVYSAGTDQDLTSVLTSVPATALEAGLAATLDMALHPLLAEPALRVERRRLAGQFRAATAVPASRAGDLADKLMWPGSPEGSTAVELAKTIPRIGADELRVLHRDRFRSGGSALAIATPGSLDAALDLAEEMVARWPEGKVTSTPAPPTGEGRVATAALPADLAYLVLLAPAVPRGHPDADGLNVAAVALGGGSTSRLFIEVREKRGLCYSIGCRYVAYAALGVLRIEAGVPPDRLEEAVGAILEQVEHMQRGTAEEEVDRARALLLGNLAMESDRPETWARRYSRDLVQLGRIRTYEEIVEAMRGVTAADVQRLTRAYLAPEGVRLSVVGPGVRRETVRKLLPTPTSAKRG